MLLRVRLRQNLHVQPVCGRLLRLLAGALRLSACGTAAKQWLHWFFEVLACQLHVATLAVHQNSHNPATESKHCFATGGFIKDDPTSNRDLCKRCLLLVGLPAPHCVGSACGRVGGGYFLLALVLCAGCPCVHQAAVCNGLPLPFVEPVPGVLPVYQCMHVSACRMWRLMSWFGGLERGAGLPGRKHCGSHIVCVAFKCSLACNQSC